MRVLFITGEFPPMQGGVGDCTNEMAAALARLGDQPHVLTRNDAPAKLAAEGRSSEEITARGIRVHRAITDWDWSSLRIISRLVRAQNPDIVHIQYQTGAFGMHPAINMLPRYLRSRPSDYRIATRRGFNPRPLVVTTFHDLRVPYLFPKAGPFRVWVTKTLARSSNAVIATNEEDYLRLYSWGAPRLSLIPIGSNIPTTTPAGYTRAAWRSHLGVGENETLLSYFGFLNESKGAETLIRALPRLPSAKLIMIGGHVGASDPTNIAYLARVKRLAAELGVASRVIWTGFTAPEEVSANLIASDICVLPYRDGASFRRGSFMAALAHGLPIVSTSSPEDAANSTLYRTSSGLALDEWALKTQLPQLCDGENILLVPPEKPLALADAITRLEAHPDLRTQLSRGALELAQNFTWDKIAERHLELYTSMSSPPSATA